ncbi:SDR family NAD(P)-dependent oxidoreductase [Lipomyces starkeyi]
MIIDGRPFIMSGGASRLGLRTTQEHTSRSSTGMKRFFKADVTDAEQLEKAVDAVVAWTKETGKQLGGVVSAARRCMGC